LPHVDFSGRILNNGGKWVEMIFPADPLYQNLLLSAEKKFWRRVKSDETPHWGAEPPMPGRRPWGST